MSRPRTTDNRKKYDQLMGNLDLLHQSHVSAGVHEDAGKYPNGPSVALVAAANHFGTATIPARPFIRFAVEDNIKKLNAIQDEEFSKLMSGTSTVEKSLDRIGFFLKTQIEKQISKSRTWAWPNTPEVAKQKRKGGALRGATPLINTGLLLRSIAFKTHVGGSISGRKSGKK